MNRNQILVRNIQHLTDARYFAAMGVDWMSIELNDDPASFMRWHTFKDWVEGVKLAAEIYTNDEMLLAKAVIDAKPQGMVFHQTGGSAGLPDMQLFFDVTAIDDHTELPECSIRIMTYHPLIDMLSFLDLDPQTTFLQAEWTPDMLSTLMEAGYKGGICFYGGEEDATGMRDYEGMDGLLERLISL
jgi:hypothetical protein